ARIQQRMQERYDLQQRAAEQEAEKKDSDGGGDGLFGAIKDLGSKALDALDYSGRVVRGVAASQFGEVNEGEVDFSLRSILAGLGRTAEEAATLTFSNAYQEQEKRFAEQLGMEAPGHIDPAAYAAFGRKFDESSHIPTGVKVAAGIGLDPLTYIAPGALARFAPKVLGPAAAIIEGPGRKAVPLTSIGAGRGAEAAGHVNVPGVPEGLEQFIGAGIGSLAGGINAPRVNITADAVAQNAGDFARAGTLQ